MDPQTQLLLQNVGSASKKGLRKVPLFYLTTGFQESYVLIINTPNLKLLLLLLLLTNNNFFQDITQLVEQLTF